MSDPVKEAALSIQSVLDLAFVSIDWIPSPDDASIIADAIAKRLAYEGRLLDYDDDSVDIYELAQRCTDCAEQDKCCFAIHAEDERQ